VPTSIAVGLDVSAASLATAQRKAARAGVEMQLDLGDAVHLPYADEAVDRVLSSFVFRHLPDDRKLASLAEIRRVLRPGGSLHMLDFLRAESADPTELMARAGLADPVQVGEGVSRLGRHAFYQAFR
jgi:ubiquinone/menaquinone biosynthesis C-methylase UbiE